MRTKTCTKCKQEKLISEFNKRSLSKDGLKSECRLCSKKDYCKNQEKYKERAKKRYYRKDVINARLLRNFGITLETYNKLFDEQQGCCVICGRHQSELSKALNVDNNHKTGQVRALLCWNCNYALGLVKEDISILLSMIDYLDEN